QVQRSLLWLLGERKSALAGAGEPQENAAASERNRRLGGGRTQSSSNLLSCGSTQAYGTIPLVTRLAVLSVALAALVVAGCGSTHHAANGTAAAGTTVFGMTTVSPILASTPRCTTSALAV